MARRLKIPVPDWAIYGAVVFGLVAGSLKLAENADAPAVLPEAAIGADALLGPVTPFAPATVVDAPSDPGRMVAGTAFSIARDGRWVTARHVVEGCRRPTLLVGGGRAVAAAVRLAPHADVALLLTEGGPHPLSVGGTTRLVPGQLAYHPGYPQGRPGEVTSRLLGIERPGRHGHAHPDEPILAWAEVGRTRGLRGTLAGLSGAPALDARGRVIGVTIAEAPRRGRIYTTLTSDFARAVAGQYDPAAPTSPVTLANYGRIADDLRRDLSVAQVVCLG